MTKTIKTIPKLRFPEFRDAPEWEEKPLGKCLLRHPDYGVNAAAVPFSENLPKYLRITDISENGYYLSEGRVSVNIEATSDNYLDEGDIVLARTGASVGKSYKYKKEDGALVFAGFLIRVKPDKTKLNSDLLFNFFSTEKYWKWVGVTSARSGQPGINGNEYASLAIPIPPTLEEQQKIADCLGSVDELITAQSTKVEALKAHKKALMQQLFPAEGETTPRLRFPEFKNAPEWEEKKLGEICEFSQGIQIPFSEQISTYQAGYIRYLYIRDFFTNDFQCYVKDIYSNKIIHENEIMMVNTGNTAGKAFMGATGVLSNNSFKISFSHKLIDNNFLFAFLTSDSTQSTIQNFFNKAGQPHLGHKNIAVIPFSYPSLKEQQKIADCLSSIDELITAQSAKVEALKTHKKALMQQLFPSTNEVNQ